MEFDNSIPIYQQIVRHFKAQIASGRLKSGERVPSVRDLSLEMGVSVNTLQKALTALEYEKLLYTERTSGRYVTRDKALISVLREEALLAEAARFLARARAIGHADERILMVIRQMTRTDHEKEGRNND